MLTLKALEEGSKSPEVMLVYHLLLSSVKTIFNLERQVIKQPASAESFKKRTGLHFV